MRSIIAESPDASRAELSRKVCRTLEWYQANGSLKAVGCRVAMLRLHRAGLLVLPPPSHVPAHCKGGLPPPPHTKAGDPKPNITQPVSELMPVILEKVSTPQSSKLWNELIDRYHYLGYSVLKGAQQRYLVQSSRGCVGAIGFASAAWKTQPRDTWIGWDHDTRARNLHYIVNNSRFLILPWVKSKNLASKILGLCARRLPADWEDRYGYTPVLLETFVEQERFAGTCYKAANWIRVGQTIGLGKWKKDTPLPIKDIFLYPLRSDFRTVLKAT